MADHFDTMDMNPKTAHKGEQKNAKEVRAKNSMKTKLEINPEEKTKEDTSKRDKADLQRELENRKNLLVHSTMEMNEKLKQMLAEEMKQISKREKTRAAEIISVFARHNFYANGFTPEELCTTLEDLGPTYVKIGQVMSSRVDLLPKNYCRALEKLRQNVKPLDARIVRAVIEQETGRTIDDIYIEFRDKPLGSASIGQAHYGVLKDGTKVVTKVQRPLIADMMRKDFVLLKKLARLISVVTEDKDDGEEIIDLMSVIEELEKVTEEELDFRIEAENTRFFREHCIEDDTKVSCPLVINELTTERMFTMTFVDGFSIAQKDKLIAQGCDPELIGRALLENYMHQVLDVGTFHADPHQGNIMISGGIPYWIDFGMIGRVSEADINLIQSLVMAMLEGDLDSLVNAVVSMGAASPQTNRNKLMEDMDVFLEKYMSVTSVNDLDMAVLMKEVSNLASRHHISMPRKYTMLARSVTTIEGVIAQLCPELNLFSFLANKLMERAAKNRDVAQSLLSTGKEALEAGKKTMKIPVLTYDVLNSMVRGRMKLNLELTGYEKIVNKAAVTAKQIVMAMFACILFFGSCLLCTTDIQPKLQNGIPLIAAVGLLFSIALAIYTVKQMSKKS